MINSSRDEGGFAPLLRRLQRYIALEQHERADLLAGFETPRSHPKGTLLTTEGRGEDSVIVLLDGLAYSSRSSATGRSQTVAVHAAGNLLNLQGFVLGSDHLSTSTLTAARTASIPHRKLKRLVEDHPGLGLALWGDIVADVRIMQEWMFGLGQRSALQNMAHLVCELQARLEPEAVRSGVSFSFPIIQEQLGEMLGLSVVHVNRTLQQLKGSQLIKLTRTTMTVLDSDGLRALAGFDGAYLKPAASALLKTSEGDGRERFRDGGGDRPSAP